METIEEVKRACEEQWKGLRAVRGKLWGIAKAIQEIHEELEDIANGLDISETKLAVLLEEKKTGKSA